MKTLNVSFRKVVSPQQQAQEPPVQQHPLVVQTQTAQIPTVRTPKAEVQPMMNLKSQMNPVLCQNLNWSPSTAAVFATWKNV